MQRTFTGRTRRRVTRVGVKVGDAVARAVITLGGIGTIVAVLLVAVFLISVALPLFRPARVSPGRSFPLDAAADAVAGPRDGMPRPPGGGDRLGADESGVVVWMLAADAAGATGVRMLATADGSRLDSRSAADCGLEGATAVRVLPGGLDAVAGFADGSFRVGRLGIDSEFLADDRLPEDFAPLTPGAARRHGTGAIVRFPGGQHAQERLVTEFTAAPSTALAARIVDVDIVRLVTGPLVAALDADGRVRVEASSSRRNLLTDEEVVTTTGATIDPPEDAGAGRPRFVRLAELGDQLFVIAEDGRTRRYEIRDVESPVLREDFAATAPGVAATAAVHVFGGAALAVADAAGGVRLFFPARTPDAHAEDGLAMVGAKEFPTSALGGGAGPAVTAMASSPRSRLLALADSAGGIRLVQTTNGVTIIALKADAAGLLDAPVGGLLLTARENAVVAVGGDRLATWAISPGYPQVSWRSLFGRVWYERYPEPVHAWETTGHEAFESKFGLVPLIFGTLKATLYSMLFATPVAILAAIYASQFMHPSWKARIKPTIEMMASLPSVVLGFVAGLVFAPLVERSLMRILTALFCVPLALLCGAFLWQLLPAGWRSRFGSWRFPLVMVVALPVGWIAARAASAPLEGLLFHGDVYAWLDGRGGSGFGGWVVALVPLAGILSAMLVGRFLHPWLRLRSRGWSQQRAAVVSLATFVGGVALAVGLAVAAASFFDALRLDTRGGLFGTYVQRNALIVAIGMSFAIIPLIFTIADDALSSVPDHLRSASLGAGATPWQTAVRVIVPAAASGLFSAVMIGLGRAVGETMIVLMAAGNTPLMGWNVFNGFQTLSAAIATELPEAARGTAHYRVLFLAALTLFAMTFVVNTAAELVRQRFRRRSHEL